jgi:hypothetical protein
MRPTPPLSSIEYVKLQGIETYLPRSLLIARLFGRTHSASLSTSAMIDVASSEL